MNARPWTMSTGEDRTTTFDEAKNWVRTFCEDRRWDPYHSPKDLAIGLVTEASELLELFRFVSEKDQIPLMADPVAREKMGDELADSLYFILRLAQMYGFDLSDCLAKKLEKNSLRYPALRR